MWEAFALLLGISFILMYWPLVVAVIAIYIAIKLLIKANKKKNNDYQKITGGNTTYNSYKPDRKDTQKNGTNYDAMSGHDFEKFCAHVLKKCNFKSVETTSISGDHGVDIMAKWKGKKIVIQCKRYSNNIGNKAVQEIFTGKTMYGADISVVLTNQYFTKSAIETAQKTGVLLWDRDKLNELINNMDKNKDAFLARKLGLPKYN